LQSSKIGVVKVLRRYPVKGMRGEDLDSIFIAKSGFVGDRNYTFIDRNAPNKAFPWMTARLRREMLLYEPRIMAGDVVNVKTPEGPTYSVSDPSFLKLLESRFNYSLELKHDRSGCYDSKPISIFGLATLRALESKIGKQLVRERFRANIYPEWDCGEPFFEDSLLGKTLQIGDMARITVVKKNSRCVVPTLDPQTAEPAPQVLKYIEEKRGGLAGVYALVEREGEVKVNDEISLLDASLDPWSQNKS